MADIWGVLRGVSDAFGFRVQLFTHAEDRSEWPALLEAFPQIVNEWPGYETILPSILVGPPGTEADPTPVVRLYWELGHFEPVFDHAGPARELLAAVERLLDGLPADAVGDLRQTARQVFEQVLLLVDGILPGTSAELVRQFLHGLVGHLGIIRNRAVDLASAAAQASAQPTSAPSRASGQPPAQPTSAPSQASGQPPARPTPFGEVVRP